MTDTPLVNPVEFGKGLGILIHEAQSPLLKRLEALESRGPVAGIDGKDGTSITPDDVAPMLKSLVDTAVAAIPAPRNGVDGAPGEKGADGKDAEPILLSDVAKELLAMPELKTLVSLLVAEGVAEYIKANPVRDGRDGKDGESIKGEPGKDGASIKGDPGEKGMDGAGIADLLIDRDGALVATMTDGRMKSLGLVVGKDGQNGRDGLSVESLDRTYDADTHEVVERFVAAGQTKELRYPAGGIRHGGYWREGTKAVAGETWTDKSIAWIAVKATTTRPAIDSPDWQIFANKGRDGDNGRNGRDLGPPQPVKLGG